MEAMELISWKHKHFFTGYEIEDNELLCLQEEVVNVYCSDRYTDRLGNPLFVPVSKLDIYKFIGGMRSWDKATRLYHALSESNNWKEVIGYRKPRSGTPYNGIIPGVWLMRGINRFVR